MGNCGTKPKVEKDSDDAPASLPVEATDRGEPQPTRKDKGKEIVECAEEDEIGDTKRPSLSHLFKEDEENEARENANVVLKPVSTTRVTDIETEAAASSETREDERESSMAENQGTEPKLLSSITANGPWEETARGKDSEIQPMAIKTIQPVESQAEEVGTETPIDGVVVETESKNSVTDGAVVETDTKSSLIDGVDDVENESKNSPAEKEETLPEMPKSNGDPVATQAKESSVEISQTEEEKPREIKSEKI